MSLTVVVSARSNGVVMRPAIWSGGRPVYCHATPMTGMLMFGKISVGVRNAASGPMIKMSSASTMNVYGRSSAMRTMPIMGNARTDQDEIIGPETALSTPKQMKISSLLHAEPASRAADSHGQQYSVMRAPPPSRSPISKQKPCNRAMAATSGRPSPNPPSGHFAAAIETTQHRLAFARPARRDRCR